MSQMIQDYARKDTICQLATAQADHGQAHAGVVVEGILEGVALYLRGAVGSETAYAVLQRHADGVVDANAAVGRSVR